MGSFKLGDNVAYNLDTLIELYSIQNAGNHRQQALLRKPIIVLIGSIAEALLFDLYLRIEHYTSEGVPNIPKHILEDIRTKTIDEFAKYIDNARSKNLLGVDPQIYDDLHELRKLRNRVHIQNTKNHFEPDDRKAFNSTRQTTAEKTLEKLMKILEKEYARTASAVKGHVRPFRLPWNDHVAI